MIGEKIGGVAETSVCKGRGQRLMQNVCDLEAWGGTASDSSVSSEPSAEWRCLDDCNHRNPEAKPVRRWLQIWNLQVLQFNHLPLVPVLFLNELMSGSTCGWTTSDHHHATGFQWLQNHSASRRNKKTTTNKKETTGTGTDSPFFTCLCQNLFF